MNKCTLKKDKLIKWEISKDDWSKLYKYDDWSVETDEETGLFGL